MVISATAKQIRYGEQGTCGGVAVLYKGSGKVSEKVTFNLQTMKS